MKEKWILLQKNIMDLAIMSLSLLLGLLTVIGFTVSLLFCFLYLSPGASEKWETLKNKKVLFECVLTNICLLTAVFILVLNMQLWSTLPPVVLVLNSAGVTLYFFCLFSTVITFIWYLARGKTFSKQLMVLALEAILKKIPVWICVFILSFLVMIVSLIFPPIIILTLGILVRVWYSIYQSTI
ncbi:TPA: hypothetical protein U1246_000980 [Streptococcus suis]|nr:hypothetical protein [Streptococcus suis]